MGDRAGADHGQDSKTMNESTSIDFESTFPKLGMQSNLDYDDRYRHPSSMARHSVQNRKFLSKTTGKEWCVGYTIRNSPQFKQAKS